MKLDKALERYKDDLDREARYRHVMEEKWQTMAQEYEKKVKITADIVCEEYFVTVLVYIEHKDIIVSGQKITYIFRGTFLSSSNYLLTLFFFVNYFYFLFYLSFSFCLKIRLLIVYW